MFGCSTHGVCHVNLAQGIVRTIIEVGIEESDEKVLSASENFEGLHREVAELLLAVVARCAGAMAELLPVVPAAKPVKPVHPRTAPPRAALRKSAPPRASPRRPSSPRASPRRPSPQDSNF